MNREDIIRMAQEAGFLPQANPVMPQLLERFAALVAKHTLANIDPSSFMTWQEGYEAGKQDGKCKYCTDGCPACDARKLPEQEPFMASYEFKQYGYYKDGKGTLKLGNIPATQPPQHIWVGLTEDEAFACQGRDYFETYKAIEAKLKEKNNG